MSIEYDAAEILFQNWSVDPNNPSEHALTEIAARLIRGDDRLDYIDQVFIDPEFLSAVKSWELSFTPSDGTYLGEALSRSLQNVAARWLDHNDDVYGELQRIIAEDEADKKAEELEDRRWFQEHSS